MRKTMEERIACFTVEFVNAVARINENLIYHDYCMDIGKKRIMFSWITGAKMTAADCLKEAGKFQEGNAVKLSGKDNCVAYMVCDGDLCDKLYGYEAYREDIYGDGDEAKKLWNKLWDISGKYHLCFEFSGRGSLVFYDDAYTKINCLLNYEFYDGGRKDSPIVIAGPDGSTRSMLRAYAYGGLIGRIATGGGNSHLAESRRYPDYLGEAYFSEDNEVDRKYLEYMDETYVKHGRDEEYKGDSLCQKLSCRLRGLLNDPDWRLIEPVYLDLILKAAQKKFAKKGGDLGERKIQTAIVKQHMKKDPEDGWCVVDMEYTVKKELSRSERFKPDIVVFDKNSGFGFIELKYADKSTENLHKHYTDTRNIIQNSEAVKTITEELTRRSSYLWEYSLISDAFYQAMKALDIPKLWQGFLFVGGKHENAVRFAEGLAAKCKDIITDDKCRFAFFPYDEENCADSIRKIRLDFHSMQDYGHFIAGEKNE